MTRQSLRIFAIWAVALVCTALQAQVRTGIDMLAAHDFAPLRGKRVGLLTNATGVDSHLRSTIDILAAAEGVKLTALYAPEHGVRGDIMAGEKVPPTTDPATGIRVYSLYGSTRKPTPAMLADIDVMVYDIQDNGCRSYTFISTMGLAMEACADAGKAFVVLDRPDPLGGEKVEGNVPSAANLSFLARYPIPYIYGLTPGELARMITGEGWMKSSRKLDLTVVEMEGWRRSMTYAQTGLPWVPTSPQLPWAGTAVFYPATGIAGELDYLSIGVGYTLPFQTMAASWIDSQQLAAKLREMEIPGVMFRPISYKPWFGFARGENLQGVEIYISDFDKAELTLIQFYVMQALAELYPGHSVAKGAKPSRFAMFDKVVASKEIRGAFFRNCRVADMLPLWHRGTDGFRSLKTKYHLYD